MKLPAYQQLSQDQEIVVNAPLDQPCLVYGPPGTGKTVIALYRSKMFASVGEPVQLIMFGRILSQYTSSAVTDLGIDGKVDTFHSWFGRNWRKKYREYAPSVGKWIYDWSVIHPKVIQDPPDSHLSLSLVIDEGQDLPKEFYSVARLMSKTLTVFADENQRLTETNSTLQEIRMHGGIPKRCEYHLKRNFRNTRQVAEVAAHFYTDLRSGIPDFPERSGPVPLFIRHASTNDMLDYIVRFASNRRDQEIGVFTRTNRVQDIVFSGLQARVNGKGILLQRYQAEYGRQAVPVARMSFGQPGITVLNYQSTKGLEFDTVFLPELQDTVVQADTTKIKMTFYVMISRARSHVVFSISGAGSPEIIGYFPEDKIDWKL